MKKTNIRINNFYIFEDEENEYYQSDIDDIQLWKEKNIEELKKDNNVTDKIKDLLNQNNLKSHCNFILSSDSDISSGGG